MKNSELHLLERRKMFNGHQERYRHFSQTCRTDMVFDVYLPPQVLKGYPAPVLYFLSGLNSDGSELVRQSGIQRFAAQWNIIVVFPDTSPRGQHVADSEEHYLGQGAGFYVNATKAPWAQHYQMESHISQELPLRLYVILSIRKAAGRHFQLIWAKTWKHGNAMTVQSCFRRPRINCLF